MRGKREALQGCNPRCDRRYTAPVIALPLVLALVLAAAPSPIEPARLAAPREPSLGGELQKGRVSDVHDADTITVRLSSGTEKVRLVGIDSPELDDERPEYRSFGLVARDYARSRIDGLTVTLEPDSKQADRDKFGRLLRYVILGDGTNLNEELVRKGYAKVYDRFSFDLKGDFKKAEAEAKRESRGLWALPPGPSRVVAPAP
jgi:micrococcal nuclease